MRFGPALTITMSPQLRRMLNAYCRLGFNETIDAAKGAVLRGLIVAGIEAKVEKAKRQRQFDTLLAVEAKKRAETTAEDREPVQV